MIVGRFLIAAVAAAIITVISGCRFEAELVIASDGSGAGSLVLIDPPPGITIQDMSRQLERAGFTAGPIATPSPNRYQCRIAWTRFDRSLGRRIVNTDGSVTLDFGPIDQGTVIVHVPGAIDAADTSGVVSGRGTATFTRGRARVTYAPGGTGPFVALAVGASLLLALVATAIYVHHRQRSRGAGNIVAR